MVEAIAVTILGALLLVGGGVLLVKGIRKRAVVPGNVGAEA
jgi:hypothetical protein